MKYQRSYVRRLRTVCNGREIPLIDLDAYTIKLFAPEQVRNFHKLKSE